MITLKLVELGKSESEAKGMGIMMRTNRLKHLLFYLLVVAIVAGTAPGLGHSTAWGDLASTAYTVTYDGNGNSGGSVPVDSKSYEQGDLVPVRGNNGGLTKSRYIFAGWNTQANGNGTDYPPGATFPMGTDNVTLYAKWVDPLGTWSLRSPKSTNELYDAAYSGGVYAAVGKSGTVISSGDGETWTNQTSGVTGDLYAITGGDGKFVAAGAGGEILVSVNGADWAYRSSGTTSALRGIAYGNGLYVAVGDDGTIVESRSGSIWDSVAGGTTNPLNAVVYADGKFVAVGNQGTIMTSSDGQEWTAQTSGTASDLLSAAAGNGKIVVVGAAGTVLTSDDSLTWSGQTGVTIYDLNDVEFGNSGFMAAGASGTIIASADGGSWSHVTSATSYNLNGIVYGDGVYVSVGYATIITSKDGASWTVYTGIPVGYFYGVAYGNGHFIAVGTDGAIYFSENGTVWKKQTSNTTQVLRSVAYGDGLFVAVGDSGTIVTSGNGADWTSQTSGTTNILNGVTYGNGLFVAVGSPGTILTSDNGEDWTEQTGASGILNSVTYGKDLYVAVGGSKAYTSSDGATWTSHSFVASYTAYGVAGSDNLLVTVGTLGGGNRNVYTSTNGASWTVRTTSIAQPIYGVAYGNETYVFVGRAGSLGISTSGTAWTIHSSGTGNELRAVAAGDGTFVVVGTGGTIVQSRREAPANYLINFDTNGGDTETGSSFMMLMPGEKIGALPSPPSRSGYTFAGWNTASDGSGTMLDATSIVGADVVAYAQWDPVSAPAAPSVTADDELNVIVGADATMEYSTDAGASYAAYDPASPPTFAGNVTVQVRVAADASAGTPAGAATTLTFTANPPAAPSVTADDELNVIVGADATMEYSTDAGASYTAYDPASPPTFAGNVTVQVRVAADASAGTPAGAATTLTFTANPPAAPSVTADDELNVIVGADATMEYSTDAGDSYTAYDPASPPTFAGNVTVLVRIAADASAGTPAGAATTLTFTANPPAAPSVTADDAANVIVGADATMEYSTDAGASYAAYDPASPPTFAGNVTVQVRVAADASAGTPAGAATTLTFTANPPAAPSVTADDAANVIVGADATMEYSTDAGASYTAYDPASPPTFAGNVTVLVRVAADASAGTPAGAATTLTFTANPPAAPSVTADDAANVIVGADATMEYSTDAGASYAAYDPASPPTFAGNVTVLVRVAADASAGTPAGAATTLTFTAGPPSAPLNLSGIAGDRQVILSWDAVPASVSYAVYKYEGATAPANASEWVLVQADVTATTYTVTGLANGTAYTFAVTAGNAGGVSDYSAAATATPRAGRTNESRDSVSDGTVHVISTNGIIDIPSGESGEVGLNDRIVINLPVGAADQELHITIGELIDTSGLLTDEETLASPIFEVLKNFDGNFKKPIKLSLKFDPAKVGNNGKAAIFYYDEDRETWVEVGGTVDGEWIWAEVDHFTKYAVLTIDNDEGALPDQTVSAFTDILGHWGASFIARAAAQKLVSGYPNGTFKPNSPVTRAEFTVMLARALQLNGTGAALAFTDQDKIGSWAGQAIALAEQAQIVSGYSDGSFRPDAQITRAEAASMIAKALKVNLDSNAATRFADDEDIPKWGKGAVEAVRQLNIVSGRGDNRFVPNDKATRAEAVVMLLRMLEVRDQA